MALVATASMSSSQLTSQSPSAAPKEPTTLGALFRIDQATGTPVALEPVKLKVLNGRDFSGGFLKPRERMVAYYIEGGASPVTFKAGEPQRFVIRLMSPGDRYGMETQFRRSAEAYKPGSVGVAKHRGGGADHWFEAEEG